MGNVPLRRMHDTPAMCVLQDGNLVYHILSMLLHDSKVAFRETMPKGKWKVHGLPWKMLTSVNTRFYLLLCQGSTVTFSIASLEMRQCALGDSDSPMLCSPRQVLDKMQCLRPRKFVPMSLGNTFTEAEGEVVDSVMSSKVCSQVQVLKIGSLDGLISLAPGRDAAGAALPAIRRVHILNVGHAGMTNRAIVDGLFHEVQVRTP